MYEEYLSLFVYNDVTTSADIQYIPICEVFVWHLPRILSHCWVWFWWICSNEEFVNLSKFLVLFIANLQWKINQHISW